ncbi:MAG: hypothetical protein JXR96_15555 [Deltaproteobacteria bacterium]|nr:hypothetical protein [Deltaproteobacteria bacterium]
MLLTYIHSAGNSPLGEALLSSGVTAIAFEDVQTDEGRLPLLDVDTDALARAEREFAGLRTRYSSRSNLLELLPRTDILLNAVMWPRGRKDHLVSREMIACMPAWAVVVDVSADIGGAIETCIRQTGHDEPTYVEAGRRHYTVANIPSIAARSTSEALAQVTLPYALAIAELGGSAALIADPALRRGLTCIDGRMVRRATAEWYGCDWLGPTELEAMLLTKAACAPRWIAAPGPC